MIATVTKAHKSYAAENWTISNVKSYLMVHGINDEARTIICEHARNCLDYINAGWNMTDNGREEDNLELSAKNKIQRYLRCGNFHRSGTVELISINTSML